MHPRLIRRAAAVIGVLTLVATGLAAAGQTAASAKPVQRFHLVRTTAPLRTVARPATRAAARVSALALPSAGDAATDAALYRKHNANEADLEGGDAVHEGEVAAPNATSHSGTSGSKGTSWEGSNHFDSRYSGSGNQFSGEPPDQGLCASNTREFEIVNSVVQVYTRTGTPLLAGTSGDPSFTGPIGITLNEFYGYPPEVDRTNGVYGLFIFDVNCQYDSGANRWYVSAAAFEQDPETGDFTGQSHVLLAVSTGSNPLGSFKVYDIDTTNNGTNGTPDHQCDGGFCFGDYPQLGFDANGVYITTNEFDLFGPNFHGAQLYALSKNDLLAGKASPRTQVIENIVAPSVNDLAYTLMPVASLPQDYEPAHGGTMYFGMSQSPFFDATANAVSLWRLTNTKSLSFKPNLSLAETSIPTSAYATPPAAQQKAGDTPFLDCFNANCLGLDPAPPVQQGTWPLDSGPGKVGAGWLRNGVVYLVGGVSLAGPGGANIDESTGLTWEPAGVHAGVAYVALRPSTWNSSVSRLFQGSIDVKGQNLIYPSLAMNAAGKGAIGVTLSGPDWYPSSAYIPFGTNGPSGSVQVVAKGAGPNDGFSATQYGGYRTRWGDYGAAATSPDGMLWVANEYIAQTCDLDTFLADTNCGHTRTLLANWSTRIVGIKS
ncbi:MAG TPA: hypothetical protein VLX89_05765 [Actinomycetota bacterium]|nr:hypothetical protein [Actinomycetota bacterium]